MENTISVFENSEFGTVRTAEINGKIHFCGSDVAKALGYSNPRDAILKHCRYVTKCDAPHPQSKNKTIEMSFIPEGDVYRLIVSSKLPTAQKFESWVFDEVLPSIRKNGMYAMDELLENPDLLVETAIKLRDEKRRRLEAEKKSQKLEIKLDESKEWYSVKRMEKLNPNQKFNWRLLKKESEKLGKEIKKCFDANYGEVNVYHVSVWESLFFDTLNF